MNYKEQIDYSSLSTYMTCPRKFLFRYVLNLERSGVPSIDLIFGSCWHLGMEAMYLYWHAHPDAKQRTLCEIATQAFQALWDREAAPWFDPDATFPKSPNRARDMYWKYLELFYETDKETTIVSAEQPFAIHVDKNLPTYVGRMDLVLEREGALEVHEHKTSKFNSPIIFTGYEASLQTEGYLTVSQIYWDALPKIVYNQALCQKSKVDHTRHTITKQRTAIERFIADFRYYTHEILRELEVYYRIMDDPQWQTDRNLVLPCFRRNAGYPCTMFFRGCEYLDLCQMRNNPLTWAAKLPEGYVIHEWNPSDHASEHKEIIDSLIGSEAPKEEVSTYE